MGCGASREIPNVNAEVTADGLFLDLGYQVLWPKNETCKIQQIFKLRPADIQLRLLAVLLYKYDKKQLRKMPTNYFDLNSKDAKEILTIRYPLPGEYVVIVHTEKQGSTFYGCVYHALIPADKRDQEPVMWRYDDIVPFGRLLNSREITQVEIETAKVKSVLGSIGSDGSPGTLSRGQPRRGSGQSHESGPVFEPDGENDADSEGSVDKSKDGRMSNVNSRRASVVATGGPAYDKVMEATHRDFVSLLRRSSAESIVGSISVATKGTKSKGRPRLDDTTSEHTVRSARSARSKRSSRQAVPQSPRKSKMKR